MLGSVDSMCARGQTTEKLSEKKSIFISRRFSRLVSLFSHINLRKALNLNKARKYGDKAFVCQTIE
ncbi:CLUMA_CG002129, isoform A [Clunio marinus]|uniref:CLUMA_CG002129, isoform A n=1 Tax=Clunio marinus TaxID=568069 RepID=A0A1J1HJY2_9DIPT|nr:CLUMA_CG002129, isoform A [Clunio marinus]